MWENKSCDCLQIWMTLHKNIVASCPVCSKRTSWNKPENMFVGKRSNVDITVKTRSVNHQWNWLRFGWRSDADYYYAKVYHGGLGSTAAVKYASGKKRKTHIEVGNHQWSNTTTQKQKFGKHQGRNCSQDVGQREDHWILNQTVWRLKVRRNGHKGAMEAYTGASFSDLRQLHWFDMLNECHKQQKIVVER